MLFHWYLVDMYLPTHETMMNLYLLYNLHEICYFRSVYRYSRIIGVQMYWCASRIWIQILRLFRCCTSTWFRAGKLFNYDMSVVGLLNMCSVMYMYLYVCVMCWFIIFQFWIRHVGLAYRMQYNSLCIYNVHVQGCSRIHV